MLTIYDLIYLCCSPAVALYLLHRYFKRKDFNFNSLKRRLGSRLADLIPPVSRLKEVVWIHAVSVGETVAASALAQELKKVLPNLHLIVSTITDTGQQKAKQLFTQENETIIHYPVDLSFIVTKFLYQIKPRVYIMMETELWPNLLLQARKRGIKCFLANGKLSEKSFLRYRRAGLFFRGPLKAIEAFIMQTEEDAQRIRQLDVETDRVFVTGNCKFDFLLPQLSEDEKQEYIKRFRIDPANRVIVAGSTHPGEEEMIIDSFMELRRQFPQLCLILAPRHNYRTSEVYQLVSDKGLNVSTASNPDMDNPDVLIVDTVGELAKIYGLGELAIVAGSFVKGIGGHNILEPATYQIPVIFGPYMQAQPEMTKILQPESGGIQIKPSELTQTLLNLLQDDEKRQALGQQAWAALQKHKGSAQRTAQIIQSFLTTKSP